MTGIIKNEGQSVLGQVCKNFTAAVAIVFEKSGKTIFWNVNTRRSAFARLVTRFFASVRIPDTCK